LVVKERRNGRSFKLIGVQAFSQDLPQPLIDAHSFWMAYDGLEHHIELRRPNMFQVGDFRPIYRIELNSHLDGQVKDLDSGRLLLNFRGDAFDRVFKSFLWRLDERSFIVPFLPRQSEPEGADQWALCLRVHRLHQHVEIYCKESSVKVQVREFENMTVSADQFLGTFIGLEHLLVLERPNGIRTIIVPHVDYTTELVGPHMKLKPKSRTPNAVIPFFSFDEDRSLKQMRPHGSETMVSWLMCCYLHGITSSAMRDPLTQLTGLEMAIAQLRRCYSTKPFDNLGYAILTKISQLSVTRCAVYDTEVVQWDHSRPSYSSSEVYKLLVHLIHSKSLYLGELHNFNLKASEKPNEMYGRAVIRYQWSCSNDLQLTDGEKQQLGITPVFPPAINRIPINSSNIVYQFVHSLRCNKTFAELKSLSFTWTQFLSAANLNPISQLQSRDHLEYLRQSK
jgi:hypothetical protein